jgi:hypothetical protein
LNGYVGESLVAAPVNPMEKTAMDKLLDDFSSYLRQERVLAPTTIANYLSLTKISGITAVARDTTYDDEKLRNAGLGLRYESLFGSIPGLKSTSLVS